MPILIKGKDRRPNEHDCPVPETGELGDLWECDVCGAVWEYAVYLAPETQHRWRRLDVLDGQAKKQAITDIKERKQGS